MPGAAEWLAYDRAAVFSGQLWRLLTGHLCHASASHLFWNLITFAALGWWLERAAPRSLHALLPAAALGVGLTLLALPGVTVYVGLSAVNAALAAFLLADTARTARGAGRAAALGLLALLALKVAVEWRTGQFTLATHMAGWTPLPAAHLAGIAIGLLWAARAAGWPRLPARSGERRMAG